VIVLRMLSRPWRVAWFVVMYLWDLSVANVIVAWEVVTPTHYIRPGIVRVPVQARGDFEITVLANLISFTPGTLTIGVDEDETALFVHALHIVRPEQVRAQVGRLERRLLWMVR
jgi:multicomponent Na+:H+ antiporter subunit E